MDKIRVKIPSTSANLGPGFDVFGVALNLFYDTVEILKGGEGVSLEVAGRYGDNVPEFTERNTAGLVAKIFLERFGIQDGLTLRLVKNIPPSCGLGSSAASAAGAALALNHLYGTGLTKEELVELAAQGEVASAGSPHPDNVSSALLGGFTIVRKGSPPVVVHIEPPENLKFALAIPKVPALSEKTKKARAVLPRTVPLEDAVYNVGSSCGIVAGFLLSDIELIGRCMTDRLAEPYRARSMEFYGDVKRSALESGAAGVSISGAGPSILAVVDSSKNNPERVASAMLKALKSWSVEAEVYTVRAAEGAEIVSVE